MIKLILTNVNLCIRSKMAIGISILLILLTLIHIPMINELGQREKFEPQLVDYLLFSMGGVFPDSLLQYLTWVCVVFPIILFVYHMMNVNSGFDLFVLTRMKKRSNWWIVKVLALIMTVLLYCVVYFLIHMIIGSMFFSINARWSSFFQMFFSHLELNVGTLLCFMMIFFFIGLTAFALLCQLITSRFRNETAVYTVFLISSVVIGFLAMSGTFTTFVSWIHFPSMLDLVNSDNKLELSALFTKFIISLSVMGISIVAGILGVRRYHY
ncbi:hypothetical protein SAMN04487866_1032 [Thermoactinomyces sp. DSM 45891]|uniref:hypothetical protein n=1 Tax=Thermoactinomyces sp. DSM 45891 TaxID=1761907 RepID=UPI000919F739|nr:hypothetical protein [Thermoactinomyces sp. DSM 45891]SFX25896.1 hypothetical protein SAMN04487866_1032 [Thermoactinomyces sp. DSM 45891]